MVIMEASDCSVADAPVGVVVGAVVVFVKMAASGELGERPRSSAISL